MNTQNQKIIIYAEILTVLFLIIRAVTWLINHEVSHHLLDNLSEVAVFILLILFVMARPASKEDFILQKGVATFLVGFGIVSLAFSVIGILVILLYLTGTI